MESPFAALGLRESLVRTLAALGYETPTPIQERTVPVMLAGRDLIGQAQTGTGKTAAFALPVLERIDPDRRETQALVLTPTRELAMQVAEAFHSYAHLMRDLSVLPVYGGAPIFHQLKRLQSGAHVVVGTPGRLLDHLDRGSLKLQSVRMIVLDEADEMLKMGFIDDVEKILAAAPAERQVALFSATMPQEVLRIADRHLRNPERIEIEHRTVAAPAIEQRFLNVSEPQKLDVLTQILELEEHEATLIFRRTKNGAAELAERLEARGFPAAAMHGDMNQTERESVIRRLKGGQIEIVVATDVAARGLDVEQISHVLNYDIPNDVEVYVHRIGRTGRAGRSGAATLFVTPRERRMMREIERFTGQQIKPMRMPTAADVAARRVAQLKETIRKNVEQGDLDLYLELVEQLVEEGRHDIAEIAAAAARLASVSRPLAGEAAAVEEPPRSEPSRPALPRREHVAAAGTGERPRPPRGAAFERPDREERKVRLSMSVGKRDGIRPADIVGSIANEAGIPGRDIGPIEIRDEITFVSVLERHVEQVLAKVAGKRFRGRALNVRPAGSGSEEPMGRPRPAAGHRSTGPRTEGPRTAGPRTAGPRTSAPRSAGPRSPRPHSAAPRARADYPSAPERGAPPRGGAFSRFVKPGRTRGSFAPDDGPSSFGKPARGPRKGKPRK